MTRDEDAKDKGEDLSDGGEQGEITDSVLNFVDLAGSERLNAQMG